MDSKRAEELDDLARAEMLREAQHDLLHAIDLIERAVRGTRREVHVDTHVTRPLKRANEMDLGNLIERFEEAAEAASR